MERRTSRGLALSRRGFAALRALRDPEFTESIPEGDAHRFVPVLDGSPGPSRPHPGPSHRSARSPVVASANGKHVPRIVHHPSALSRCPRSGGAWSRRGPAALSILLLWGVAHIVLFPLGAFVHDYWSLYLGPGVALAAASGLVSIANALGRRRRPFLIGAATAFSAVLLVSGIRRVEALPKEEVVLGRKLKELTKPEEGVLLLNPIDARDALLRRPGDPRSNQSPLALRRSPPWKACRIATSWCRSSPTASGRKSRSSKSSTTAAGPTCSTTTTSSISSRFRALLRIRRFPRMPA